VYHLLGLLEADAAGVVATAATKPQFEALQALHQELETSARPGDQDHKRFFEINERFHMLLLEIANNRWRNQMVADLRKVMKLNRHNSLLKSGRIDDSLNEHRALMTALLAHDPALARQRMQEHFKNGLEAAS
jgi:DNA-binding GntR family transcriptional regulator